MSFDTASTTIPSIKQAIELHNILVQTLSDEDMPESQAVFELVTSGIVTSLDDILYVLACETKAFCWLGSFKDKIFFVVLSNVFKAVDDNSFLQSLLTSDSNTKADLAAATRHIKFKSILDLANEELSKDACWCSKEQLQAYDKFLKLLASFSNLFTIKD